MADWALQLVAAPEDEPVSMPEIRSHLRIDDASDDFGDLGSKVSAAREEFENATRRQLVTATWRLILDRFPKGRDPLYLPRPPLQSVTLIRYRDPSSGSWTTLDAEDYAVSPYATPGRVTPAYGECWPVARCEPGAVEVTFVAGYGPPSAVPALAKNAIKMLAGTWYANREDTVTGTTVAALPAGFERIVRRFDPLVDFHPFGE